MKFTSMYFITIYSFNLFSPGLHPPLLNLCKSLCIFQWFRYTTLGSGNGVKLGSRRDLVTAVLKL